MPTKRVHIKCAAVDPCFIETIDAWCEDEWWIEFDMTEASDDHTYISVTEADGAMLMLLEPKGFFEPVDPDFLNGYWSAQAAISAGCTEIDPATLKAYPDGQKLLTEALAEHPPNPMTWKTDGPN